MLEEKNYRAVVMGLLIVYGFIYRVTAYIKSPKIAQVHAIHSFLMGKVISFVRKQQWVIEEFKDWWKSE